MRWFLKELQFLVEFVLLWPIVMVVRRLSEQQSQRFALGLSRVLYRVLWHDREWCLLNLRLVYGASLSPAQRTRLAMQAFENVVRTRFEVLRWTPEWMEANVVVVGGEEAHRICRDARQRGLGLIVLTAHLGNFELLSAWANRAGWNTTVMYRPQDNWRVERLLARARAAFVDRTVPRSVSGLRTLVRDLRSGRRIGLVMDQSAFDGLFVDFLGVPAASATGPAWLALKTRAPVLMAISYRAMDGRHHLVFHPPFKLIHTGDRGTDLHANTEQFLQAMEPYVLAHPEQYNWLHPRWRHRPDGSTWTLSMPYEALLQERTRPPYQWHGAGASPVGVKRAA